MSLKMSKADIGERNAICAPVLIISAVSVILGVSAFFLRVNEVGAGVSFADAVLLSASVPLSSAAALFVYRFGGFDIFLYPFARLFATRGRPYSDYFEFRKREHGARGIVLPLFLIGLALFSVSAILAFV